MPVLPSGSQDLHPLINQNVSPRVYSFWHSTEFARGARLDTLRTLGGIAVPREGLVDALNFVACHTLRSTALQVYAAEPGLSGLKAIKEVYLALRENEDDVAALTALQLWFEQRPEKREELVIPGSWLDTALFGDDTSPLGRFRLFPTGIQGSRRLRERMPLVFVDHEAHVAMLVCRKLTTRQ